MGVLKVFKAATARLKRRFFFRLFLLYSLIVVGVIAVMVGFILERVSGTLLEQSVSYHQQIVATVSEFFYKQNRSFKKALGNFYALNWENNTRMIQVVERVFSAGASPEGETLARKIDDSRTVTDFLYNYSLPADTDIKNIACISTDFSTYINANRGGSSFAIPGYLNDIFKDVASRPADDINRSKAYVIPAFRTVDGEGMARAYCIYDYLRDAVNPGRAVGSLVAVFSPDSIRSAYRAYEGKLMGDIYLLTGDMRIIYDSTGRYGSFPYAAQLSSAGGQMADLGSRILVKNWNEEYGFCAVGVIDKTKITMSTLPLVWGILASTVLSILLILPLSFWSMRTLRRRVERIRGTLALIQGGDLGARAPVGGAGDEIDEIAMDLNEMGQRLDRYIQQEYALQLNRTNAELKQKAAELYALQSQIDPHFLYNTLEAIRMRALSSGDQLTGDMIKLLARMFRRRVSGDIVVALREELNDCKSYLELYNLRFEGRISVALNVDHAAMECALPKHLLQPVIENTIVHGVDFQKMGNQISISAGFEDGLLRIAIFDNGQGIVPEKLEEIRAGLRTPMRERGERIGLGNVDARIKLIYGEAYGLEVQSVVGEGTRVTITVPPMTKEKLLTYVQGIDRR